MSLSAHVDIRGLVPWSRNANANTIRAAQAAGSSALRAMRAEGSRRIRERKGIQAGQIDRALSLLYPKSKDVFAWALVAKSKPIPLIAFGARQVGSGVSVEVTKGKRSIVRGAFIATMQSGHRGVFMRQGNKQVMRKGRYKGKLRQPIKERFSATISSALGKAAPEVLNRGASVFKTTFERMSKVRQ